MYWAHSLIHLFIFLGERNDYVGGIDNESLDFSQLEDFINNETDTDPS